MLLKNNKSPETKLVVALCGQDPCRNAYELDLTGSSEQVFLSRVPVGSRVSQTEAIPTNASPKKIALSGIRVTYFEQAEVVLYWNKKHNKIEEVQTAD